MAVRSLHLKGYLYLDLKPENVIVVNGVPKLLDMGTARRISARTPSRVIGSDNYMSPEQREKRQLSAASDVYSLAVVLFEILTGKLPFARAKSSRPVKGRAVSVSQAVPRSLAQFLPNARKELVEIVGRCLNSDPSERPELEELIISLNSLISSGPHMWPVGMSL